MDTSPASAVLALTGPAVLLNVHTGQKKPIPLEWQKIALEDMTPDYLGELRENIGVSLGSASDGLHSIDCDDDDYFAEMGRLNPRFADTLQSHGARGGNYWVRIEGDFPKSGKIKLRKNTKVAVGEWRSTGNQTIIHGTHPSGIEYRTNGKPAITLKFSEITWPDWWRLPWTAYEKKPATTAPVQDTTPEEEKDTPAPLQNPKGWIVLPSGPTGNYDSSVTLFEAMRGTGVFFLRGGKTCEVRVDENDSRKRVDIIKPMELVSTCERLGAPVAAWGVDEKKRPVIRPGARASKPIAEMWLESSARHALPPIKSVLNCPALALEGEDLILLPPGYHEPTGTLVASDIQIDEMSHEEALREIAVLLRDFDFVTPADSARALAMLITPALVAGGLLKAHIPIFGVEANASQSGKGYLCELVQTVYAETPSIVTKKEGGVGSFDESLAAALISGRPFIQIDNVRNKLASQFFESVLTTPKMGTVACRTPHKPEVHIDPSRVIFHITSNGLEMTEDLANRACIVRIRKREKWNPPRFAEGGLLDHVAANRHRFLGAVFHLVARWVEDGRKRTDDTRAPGRFREWGQTLDWIVQELAGCPPLLEGHEQVQARVSSPGLVWVRDIGMKIVAIHPDRHESWTASNLVEFASEQGIPIPGTKDDGDEGAASRAVGRIMGRLFGNSREVQADDILVSREDRGFEREDGKGTTIRPAYRFERFPINPHQSHQCT